MEPTWHIGPFPVWRCRLQQAESVNLPLLRRFEQVRERPDVGRSHLFHGRYENLYIPLELIPELNPVRDRVRECCAAILGHHDFRIGFWFNDMGPDHVTTLHTHDDDDELLSAVYYARAPGASGDLILHGDGESLRVTPEEGILLLFPPDLPHEVEANRSGQRRLSIAFNAGPAS